VWLEFNPALGQRVYAGCDAFLMPSRYEPCGLGQLISLRYGAVPIVRRTGGLNDTVTDAGAADGTGFVFEAADAGALRDACGRALDEYANDAAWRAMQERGMRQDWSWTNAAGKYAELYRVAVDDRRRAIEAAAAAS
jgi:starch synthase